MSLLDFKYLQTIGNIQAIFNTALTAGDTVVDVFRKLQGLLVKNLKRSVLKTTFSGGASSTADIAVLTHTVEGNTTNSGDVFEIQIAGVWTKPLGIRSDVSFWVKVDTLKEAIVTFTSTSSVTSQAFNFKSRVTFRTSGSSAIVVSSSELIAHTTATDSTYIGSTDTSTITVNTDSNFNLQVGFNFSNSNASNNVTAITASIIQV